MSLSNSTINLLRTQYFDDYYTPSTTDPTKLQGSEFDFHRILFRPRYAVQSRELTQLQTLLQTQIERLGTANFKQGQPVYGGETALNTGVFSGKVTTDTNAAAFFDRTLNTSTAVYDISANTNKATILQFAMSDEITTIDSNYLVIKYETGSSFSPSTVLQLVGESATATFAAEDTANVFHSASIFSIAEGVFFISGFLVRCRPQAIVLDLFTDKPNAIVGLTVIEEVLDELDDIVGTTLLDPANQNAPGAHRFRLRLVLSSRGLNAPLTPNFIALATIINGVVQKTNIVSERFVKWSEMNTVLARRTFDESGNYMIKNFAPVIDVDPDAEDHFRLSIGPGKAYVNGWEAEKTEPTDLSLRKGRATLSENNNSIALQVGNFTYAVKVAATIPTDYFSNTATVDLHCVSVPSINTSSNTTYAYSKIGTARIRMLETYYVPSVIADQANTSVYKLFFYDTTFDTITGNCTTGTANGRAITFSGLVANGTPAVNDAIAGATVVLGGTNSRTSGTFTVNNYSCNTSHFTITLKEFVATTPNSNTTYRLLFRPKDIDAFAKRDAAANTIQAPYSANLSFQADVDPTYGKIGVSPNIHTVIEGSTRNTLLYELPKKFITANSLSTDTATFSGWLNTSTAVSANTAPGDAANVAVTLVVTGNTFTVATGNNIGAADAQRLLVIFEQTADANGRGRIIQFSDAPGAADRCISNVSIVKSGSQHNITFTYHSGYTNGSTSRSFVGMVRSTVIGLGVRQKTLMLGNTTAAHTSAVGSLTAGQIEFHSLDATAGAAYSLKTADVFRIVKILYKNANTAFNTGDLANTAAAVDVTDQFTLDDGQRDNTYDYSRLLAKKSAGNIIRPSGRLLVIFDWFSHSGRGYCTVDSYLSSANILKGMTYDIIPSYTSSVTGQTVALRDVLDFRPVRSNHEALEAAAFIYAANDVATDANTTYMTSDNSSYLAPTSDDEWIGSYEFYLGRIDQIAVAADGQFRIVEGQDAVSPIPPKTDTGDLLLFQVKIPPYTLVDANGVPIATSLTTFDHKRFTMNDISSIEDRIAHLEYYTALNSLETIARDQNIEDGEGNDRFKNGIIVDSFHGGDVGDVADPSFTASIDPLNRELRTAFRTFDVQFSPDLYGTVTGSTTYGIVLVGDMATLAYTEAPLITQNLATHAISVNPFDVASFYGNVKLSPAVDIWKEVLGAPAQVIDMGGPSEAWVAANNPSFTNWGEWEQTWSGRTASPTQRQYALAPGQTWAVHTVAAAELSYNDVETQTIYQRQGTAFEYEVATATASLGNRVVDTSIIHNVRPRDIVFAGDGLKPQVNIYTFFDGTTVDPFVQRANILQIEDVAKVSAPTFYMGQTVYVGKCLTGVIDTAVGLPEVTGTGTFFEYELVPGQLVRIKKGVNIFDAYLMDPYSNTTAFLYTGANATFTGADVFALTPVTIADIAPRYTGANVSFTLKVVRAHRDADVDQVVPYGMIAGSLRPEKQAYDTSTGPVRTLGATLFVPASARCNAAALAVTSAVCVSGIVRDYDSASGKLRLDNDITDAQVSTVGTLVYIAGGPGAGQSTVTTGYTAANQTAILAAQLTGVVAGESIYSIGRPQTDGFISGSTTSGRAGTIAGVFHMQSAQFPVGSRLLRLTDSATNTPAEATTSAEAHYEASGLTVTQQDTTISSRSLGLKRTGPKEESFTVTDNTVENIGFAYVDPLAETVLIDAKLYPQGVYVTSVDLCFAAVPTNDVPVVVELREVVNGYPSSRKVLPCCSASGVAQVSLRPDQVFISSAPSLTTAGIYTRFTFDAPVYVSPGTEAAIIVRSDSNDYRVWTAELGGAVVGAEEGTKVSKQPYAGSFFKSQNASTWTESPFEDLMFRLNRALWTGTADAQQEGVLVARGVTPNSNTTFDSFQFYPHDVEIADVTASAFTLDIKPFNVETNDLTDSEAVRYSGIPNEWQPLVSRAMLQGSDGPQVYPNWGSNVIGAANTVDALVTLATWSPDVAPYIDLKKTNMVCVQHFSSDMGLASEELIVRDPGLGYLPTLQLGQVTVVAGEANVAGANGTLFSTTLLVGDTVILGGSIERVVQTITSNTLFSVTVNVAVSNTAQPWFTYGTASGNNVVALIVAGGNGTGAEGYTTVGRDGKINAIVLTSNGSGYTGNTLLTVPAPTTPGGFTAAQNTASLAYNNELGSEGNSGTTRYFTRPVTLADGFEGRDIVVYFDAYRPVGSKFYVYYKVLPVGAGDSERFMDQTWRLMTQVTSDSTICTSYAQFKEFNFKTLNGQALDATTDVTDKFRTFSVKVVMASDSTVDLPRICNFRAIALDS